MNDSSCNNDDNKGIKIRTNLCNNNDADNSFDSMIFSNTCRITPRDDCGSPMKDILGRSSKNQEIHDSSFYPVPKCKATTSRLASLIDPIKYPTLINGCHSLHDIEMALKEGMDWLGLDDIWDNVRGGNRSKVLHIPRDNGNPEHYVKVPVSSTEDCFASNARNEEWIDNILEVAGTEKLSKDNVMDCIMVYLIKNYPKVLERVGEKLKIPNLMTNEKMDAHTAAVMWNKANVTLRGPRDIKKYIHSVYSFWVTPAQRHINAISDHFTELIHVESEVGEKTITWWHKPIDEAIVNILENEWDGIKFNIDVVFGGDHGCLVFGAVVKIILWKGVNVVRSVVEKVAHIDCENDTYKILQKTCAPVLIAS